jgi:cytochrome c
MMFKALSTLGLSLTLLAPTLALADDAAMAAAGEQVFTTQCTACHSADSSKNTFGPSLTGVAGRKAGSLPRFAYSDAMSNADFSWTDENLRKWISDNEAFVPGTRMRHVAITDKAQQDYLIAYLKTL